MCWIYEKHQTNEQVSITVWQYPEIIQGFEFPVVQPPSPREKVRQRECLIDNHVQDMWFFLQCVENDWLIDWSITCSLWRVMLISHTDSRVGCQDHNAGQEKKRVPLPGASKFYFCASENGSLVGKWN